METLVVVFVVLQETGSHQVEPSFRWGILWVLSKEEVYLLSSPLHDSRWAKLEAQVAVCQL